MPPDEPRSVPGGTDEPEREPGSVPQYDPQSGREPVRGRRPSAADRESDEDDLRAGLRGVAGLVAGARGVVDLLSEMALFAVRAIPAADGAGVALLESHSLPAAMRTGAATAPFVRTIDALQFDDPREGPTVACMRNRRPTISGSLGSDERWPRFGGRVARMGVHSALSLPLLVGDDVIGAISAYAHHRDAFAEHAVRLGADFCKPAAVSIYNAQLLAAAQQHAERVQRTLDSRALVDQAIGIIRSRSGVSGKEAFDRLVHVSQHENVKLYAVAERLVDEAVRRARGRRR